MQSKSPSENDASQTPSHTQSSPASTSRPVTTVISSEPGTQVASQASGGHDANGTVRSRTRVLYGRVPIFFPTRSGMGITVV